MGARHKRTAKNLKNLMEYFDGEISTRPANPFLSVTPEQALQIIQIYNKDRSILEAWASYARRFKQASEELTVEDLTEARDLMAVKQVMES